MLSIEWHDFHFPTCNEIHEIDIRLVVRKQQYGVDIILWAMGYGGMSLSAICIKRYPHDGAISHSMRFVVVSRSTSLLFYKSMPPTKT
jgi:hypothetical protein